MIYARTEEELISHWLDLAHETFGQYAWAAPGTWAAIAKLILDYDPDDTMHQGSLDNYSWIKPKPFAVKILMNPFADEGRLYLAHAGTEYFEYASL